VPSVMLAVLDPGPKERAQHPSSVQQGHPSGTGSREMPTRLPLRLGASLTTAGTVIELSLDTSGEALTRAQDVAITSPPNVPSGLALGPFLTYAVVASRSRSDVAVSCAVFATAPQRTALARRRLLMAPT
jgi:hypothetical protein